MEALPDEVTDAELSPPEGDFHFRPKIEALVVLEHRLAELQGELERLERR